MEIVFLKATQKLVKEISSNSVTPYPLVKKFTSEHNNFEKTQEGLEDFFNALQEADKAGKCLLKGLLKKPFSKLVLIY